MDSCSVHHVNEVREVLRQAGILVLFLPPFSPDLNPLEEAFSYIKQYLRKHDELLQAIRDLTDVIMQAFQSITARHCNSWISLCTISTLVCVFVYICSGTTKYAVHACLK